MLFTDIDRTYQQSATNSPIFVNHGQVCFHLSCLKDFVTSWIYLHLSLSLSTSWRDVQLSSQQLRTSKLRQELLETRGAAGAISLTHWPTYYQSGLKLRQQTSPAVTSRGV